jgi:aldehyde dehydrogenase (NAD+)
MIEKRQFYINGQWVNSVDGRDYNVVNPSTEEPVAVISLGGQSDTDTAVAAANAAYPAWIAPSVEEILALV